MVPKQRGEDAAPVYVASQQYRGAGVQGHPHIDDFVLLEVDFGRAARALDDYHVVLRPEGVQRAGDALPEHGLGSGEVARRRLGCGLAQQHHLGSVIGFRLEQNGVHFHLGFHAAGFGLHRLGPAQLAAGGSDEGVVGHILRLERGHAVAVLPEDAAQRGDQHALANVRRSALHHDHAALGRGTQTVLQALTSGFHPLLNRDYMVYKPNVRPSTSSGRTIWVEG